MECQSNRCEAVVKGINQHCDIFKCTGSDFSVLSWSIFPLSFSHPEVGRRSGRCDEVIAPVLVTIHTSFIQEHHRKLWLRVNRHSWVGAFENRGNSAQCLGVPPSVVIVERKILSTQLSMLYSSRKSDVVKSSSIFIFCGCESIRFSKSLFQLKNIKQLTASLVSPKK